MIIQRPALNERFEMSRDFVYLQARHITQLHKGVGANVPTATGTAGQLGVGAPGSLHLAGGLELGCQPTLEIGGVDPAHLTEKAGANDVTRKTRRPVAEIRMGYAEWNLILAHRLNQLVGFLQIQTERFLAEHGNAGFDGLHGRVKMDVVRSNN